MTDQNSANEEVNENVDAQVGAEGHNPEETQEIDELTSLKAKLEEAEAKSTDQQAEFLRARADLENSRKRMEKEKQTFIKYGLEGVLKDILPCLDSFEQATTQNTQEQSAEDLKEGVLLVKKQLLEVLAKHGLEQVESNGSAFDPELHQAIRKEESDAVEVETVGDVYQQGFTLHDRLLRPAMVSVLMPKA
jgi:molecular chaperone GrpE